MVKIKIRSASRVTYDPQNVVIRSYFDPAGIEGKQDVFPEEAAQDFLESNLDVLMFEIAQLEQFPGAKHVNYESIRYQQKFNNIPVYDATVVVNISTKRNKIISFFNSYDYNIPEDFNVVPQVTDEEAMTMVIQTLAVTFEEVTIKSCTPFIYRVVEPPRVIIKAIAYSKRTPTTVIDILRSIPLEPRIERELLLVWQVIVDVNRPVRTRLEAIVEAKTGNLVHLEDQSSYVNGEGKVFIPDPIIASGNTGLCWSSDKAALEDFTGNIDLLDLDPADADGYHLSGPNCIISDIEIPDFQPPVETQPSFIYPLDTLDGARKFLSVMAYFWIDNIQRYVHNTLEMPYVCNYKIRVDPQGFQGMDNSHCVPDDTNQCYLGFGEGGVPDTLDAAVILHEYGHAIHYSQGFSQPSDLKEGFSDLFAHIFLDRYNPNKILRGEIFPADSGASVHCYKYWDGRRLNRNYTYTYDKFDLFSGDKYRQGLFWAETVWHIYNALGGDSQYQARRDWAADLVLKLHLQANDFYSPPSGGSIQKHEAMATALKSANLALDGWHGIPDGLFHKVIDYFCANMRLRDPLDVDVYIDDGRNGGYEFQEVFWQCQNLVVRRLATDDPTMGHQNPVFNQPNYIWVKVKKGQPADSPDGNPGAVTVKAFHCPPTAGLVWPVDWLPTIPPSLPATTLSASNTEWVGPFEFVPTEIEHYCIFAIVEAENDPANTESVGGNVQHWMLVPFDNNIAQRNIAPVAGDGKKSDLSFKLRNRENRPIEVILELTSELPKGWKLSADVPFLEPIQLGPNTVKQIKLEVEVPDELAFTRKDQRARLTVKKIVDGIPVGGISFDYVHPSIYLYGDRIEPETRFCRRCSFLIIIIAIILMIMRILLGG